jgi:hypothetical protein
MCAILPLKYHGQIKLFSRPTAGEVIGTVNPLFPLQMPNDNGVRGHLSCERKTTLPRN